MHCVPSLNLPSGFEKNKSLSGYSLRTPSDRQTKGGTDRIPVTGTKQEKNTQIGPLILCRECLQTITDPFQRIMINGAHNHTFANPHGLVFEIGCYRSAVGCGFIGQPTPDFSWFKGFMWRISVCSACLTHLGWLFVGTEQNNFLGLIQNRLIATG